MLGSQEDTAVTDFIASKDGTVTRDPGAASPDPARRPGQPGAERQQVDDTPASDVRPRPGEMDERGNPLPMNASEQGHAEPEPMADLPDLHGADLHEASPPLSDGSTRAGPV